MNELRMLADIVERQNGDILDIIAKMSKVIERVDDEVDVLRTHLHRLLVACVCLSVAVVGAFLAAL